MRALLLAPHNDDETLFAGYLCLRYRPHVIVVLKSQVEEDRYGITATTREAETAAAMKILGCTWEQWPYLDTAPDWAAIRDRLDLIAKVHPGIPVIAPAVEPDGHEQHNQVGKHAAEIFEDRLISYLTYTRGAGRSTSDIEVPVEPGWDAVKRAALDCYRSQIELGNTAAHFTRPQTEYLAA